MYGFTYLALHITFWPWKYDFWTEILLNLPSLYFSGEALIILHHIVPACCVQKKLNASFLSMSFVPVLLKATSLYTVSVFLFSQCAFWQQVWLQWLPCLLSMASPSLNRGLLWALRLCVNGRWCGLTWLTRFHLKLWIRSLPIGRCRMCARIPFVRTVMCCEWKLCGCSLQMENHLHSFLRLLQWLHSYDAVK